MRAIIVSSETLSRLDGTWTLIENNTLVSIDVKTENGPLIITLTAAKTFRHAPNTPQETCTKDQPDTQPQHQRSDSV
jgi:hypothetical protein